MDNYNPKPNSHKYKAEQQSSVKEREKMQKVVKGTAKVKKKSAANKLTDVFIAEDASNVKSYIFTDVLVPAAKKLISDIVRDGIEMLLYGGTGRSGRDSHSSRPSYVQYSKYSDRRDDRRYVPDVRNRFDFGDIIFETRGEAEAVREQMDDVIDRYGFVTVADMYDMAGLTEPYTANKYGWTNIRTAEAVRMRDGYILKLPKPMPID